ncbi:MAG TPA: TetR/AcrR family transcriptional regulator [Galbitalea sp.]|jgi:AcrR family transcriptional regulator
MQTSEPGLRERKRAETRTKLETAAVTIVLRDGLEHATLDAICEGADVSNRTFFNYFESKEDAIIGANYAHVTDEAITEILGAREGQDTVEAVIRLVFGVLNPTIEGSALLKLRMKVFKEYPHLLGRIASQFERFTQQLNSGVQAILKDSHRYANETPAELEISADAVLSLCVGSARSAVKEWVASGSTTPIEEVIQRAIGLVRTTVERLK